MGEGNEPWRNRTSNLLIKRGLTSALKRRAASDVLLHGFRDYQLNERGLARTSVVDSRRLVQNFLEKQVPGGDSGGSIPDSARSHRRLDQASSQPGICCIRKTHRHGSTVVLLVRILQRVDR